MVLIIAGLTLWVLICVLVVALCMVAADADPLDEARRQADAIAPGRSALHGA